MRVSRACDRCRTQKIKCSGTYPCTTCTKHKRQCVYNSSQTPNKQADSMQTPTMLHFPPERELPYVVRSEDKAYIKHLENRIQYLESRLLLDPGAGQFAGADVAVPARDGETEDEDTTTLIRPSSKWRYTSRNHIVLVQELCGSAYHGLDAANQSKVALPRHQYFGWNLSGTHYLSSDPLPDFPDPQLPQPLQFYVDYYLREINPLFALIHELVFRQQWATYTQTLRTRPAAAPQELKLFEAMLYLMVVLAIRFSEFERPTVLLALLAEEERLFKVCYHIISVLSFQWESFELIQCWLLVTLYLRVSHRQSSYFAALGHAATMAKAMDLHRARNMARQSGTHYEALKSVRIFWALFTFDRVFGIQSGKFPFLVDRDVELAFPTMDVQAETAADNWLTAPALAMIHIARVSTAAVSCGWRPADVLQYQHVNRQLVELGRWLEQNGFSHSQLFAANGAEPVSSMVRAQVVLHYHDLVLSVHGKVLFNFVGRRVASPGLKLEMVVDACTAVGEVLAKTHAASRLYSPWPLHLLLLFNVGVNWLVLINAGLYAPQARAGYARTIELLTALKSAHVTEDDRVVIKRRFKMADECLWALNTCGKVLSLRFVQELQGLQTVGADPGSSDVNRATFALYGYFNDRPEPHQDDLAELIKTGKRRKTQDVAPAASDPRPDGPVPSDPSSSTASEFNDFNPSDPSFSTADSALYNNLLWFEQLFDPSQTEF